MATENSLNAIEMARKAYTKLVDMPGGDERDKLIQIANDGYTTALLMWRNPEMELQPHQQESLDKLRAALGESDG
jgi:hypothetical protein